MDAAHELGHFIMHPPLVTAARSGTTPNQELEAQAKAFAGSFLVPSGVWMEEAPRSTNPYAYLEASERWGVSVAGLIVRSFRVGVLNASQYQSAMVRYSSLGWRTGEPRPATAQPEQPEILRTALRSTGDTLPEISSAIGAGPHLATWFASSAASAERNLIAFPARARVHDAGVRLSRNVRDVIKADWYSGSAQTFVVWVDSTAENAALLHARLLASPYAFAQRSDRQPGGRVVMVADTPIDPASATALVEREVQQSVQWVGGVKRPRSSTRWVQ
jgi:hypothetical protein